MTNIHIMRIVIQRVDKASVSAQDNYFKEIGNGLLVLLGIETTDDQSDIDWMAKKLVSLRIFDDENGVMNLSVQSVQGEILLISQFTLLASTKKGNRPSYLNAASPDISIPLYEGFAKKLEELLQREVPTGVFGSNMKIELVNDGPVTIIIDSKNRA